MKYILEKTTIDRLKDFLDTSYDDIYQNKGETLKLKGIVPVIDDGEISELLMIGEYDSKEIIVNLIVDGDELQTTFTESGINRVLSCNKIAYDDNNYSIVDKIYNIDDGEITLVLEKIK